MLGTFPAAPPWRMLVSAPHLQKSVACCSILRMLLCSSGMVTKERVPCCRYGYKGFYDRRHKPVVLTRKVVEGIQLAGGTILVSRCHGPHKLSLHALSVRSLPMIDTHRVQSGDRSRTSVFDICARSSNAVTVIMSMGALKCYLDFPRLSYKG